MDTNLLGKLFLVDSSIGDFPMRRNDVGCLECLFHSAINVTCIAGKKITFPRVLDLRLSMIPHYMLHEGELQKTDVSR